MIYDKIKIYVTAHIAEILLKDTESFEFFKKDGRSLNKNALLTRLVVNYSDEFRESQRQLLEYLKTTVRKKAAISEPNLKALCFEISDRINERAAAPENEKFDKLVSLKPTKESQPVIDYIEEYELEGCSLSEYFRNMFASYAALPQDKREAVIFKKQREALLSAVKQKKKVFLSVSHGKQTSMEVAPYALTATKEELHGYLLGFANNTCAPLRLSRILSVTVLNEDAVFSDEQKELFEKMLTYGPQFIYRPYEQEVKVELTARGMEKFRKMYVHRPIPTEIRNNCYIFHCSHSQILQYFQRFGSDAYILSPPRLREEMYRYYANAFRYYQSKRGEPTQNASKKEP
ncbi:MAG: WYL domain-containing protein [Clostridia bacterium]|nr:WYL domain-containing protein [Clostridia bacterium]